MKLMRYLTCRPRSLLPVRVTEVCMAVAGVAGVFFVLGGMQSAALRTVVLLCIGVSVAMAAYMLTRGLLWVCVADESEVQKAVRPK